MYVFDRQRDEFQWGLIHTTLEEFQTVALLLLQGLPFTIIRHVSRAFRKCTSNQARFSFYCEWKSFFIKLFENGNVTILTVFITKFVIGCPGAYLSRNRRVITWVFNYRCPFWTFFNWIPSWFSCQLRALWWLSSQCFLQFSKLRKSATDVFAQKKLLEDIFNSEICYRYD